MEQKNLVCRSCGSEDVKELGEGLYVCAHCNVKFVLGLSAKDSEYIISHTEKALWKQTVEQIEKALYNLDEAAHKRYINDAEIVHWCGEVKKLIPGHFMASFYETAVGSNKRAFSEFLGEIDAEEHISDVPEILRVAVKLISAETFLAVNNLVTRAYGGGGQDATTYAKWNEKLRVEQQKIDELVYDVSKTRDVFIAYKSEDWKDVERLVDFLENEEKLECFVAARNLQHGRANDYEQKLKTAMDHCRAVVFVSTKLSRMVGDARNFELKYIQEKDYEYAPSEYRAQGAYKQIPKKYKKPRVEYVVEQYAGAAAEGFTNEFFTGYERVYAPDVKGVALSLFSQFDRPQFEETVKTVETSAGADKFCVSCGAENPTRAKLCLECGNTEFVETYEKYIELKTEREVQKRLEEERKKAEAERKKLKAEREALEKQKEEAEERAKKLEAKLRAKEAQPVAPQDRVSELIATKIKEAKEKAQTEEDDVAKKRAELLKRLADMQKEKEEDDAQACFDRALAFYAKGKYTEAATLFRDAAEKGHAKAQYNLGVCYKDGTGVTQDFVLAVKWYRKAAEQGELMAQFCLGCCYGEGVGVKQDYYDAVKWYRKAAENGNAEAQCNLGGCYERGHGVTQNYIMAVKWYRKSAEQGCPQAQCNLGVCYERGIGVNKDYDEAEKWYGKAAERGNKAAEEMLVKIKRQKLLDKLASMQSDAEKPTPSQNKTEKPKRSPISYAALPDYDKEEFEVVGTKLKKYNGRARLVVIPEGITDIEPNAFWGCKDVENIEIPNSVRTIRDHTFEYCGTIKRIKLPNKNTTIGEKAFYHCTGLTDIAIPVDERLIGRQTFAYCESLASLVIPDSVTQICTGAFSNCTSLTSVIIPSRVTRVDGRAFANCTSLTSITIPSSVQVIDYNAFDGCKSLISIRFDGTKKQWKDILKGSQWRRGVPNKCRVILRDGTEIRP